MDEQKQKLTDRLKQAQNILVTVSTNPSVDQLAAAIGLTLVLNKLGKHGTAVFSGQVPSTIEFLKPEETLEKNTDSLRDFIIALDKSKADKLRYKVEDQVVRIFITPYKTSLTQKDLDFSQGDFNVDVVVALGVSQQQDLDAAITAHGRILHDATVASLATSGQGSLGSINWLDSGASSLSEMIVSLADGLDAKVMDAQIATALLTGIVATTDRFSNDKTSPKTMSASAELMAAGANQQLIATELTTTTPIASSPADQPAQDQPGNKELSEAPAAEPKPEPGTLEIEHPASHPAEAGKPPVADDSVVPPQVHVDEEGKLSSPDTDKQPEISAVRGVTANGLPVEDDNSAVTRQRLTGTPQITPGDLTANTEPESLDPATEELTLPPVQSPLLSHNESVLPSGSGSADPPPSAPPQPPNAWQPPQAIPNDETLAQIEQAVDSPHLQTPSAQAADEPSDTANVDDARSAVEAALNGAGTTATDPLEPIAALNAQPLGPELQHGVVPSQPLPAPNAPLLAPLPNTGFSEPTPGNSPADETLDMPLPTGTFSQPAPSAGPFVSPSAPVAPASPSAFPGAPQPPSSQTPPPPVPPPMLPPLQ